jgi:hypothetical protein
MGWSPLHKVKSKHDGSGTTVINIDMRCSSSDISTVTLVISKDVAL